eukprot:5279846-Amphidinium_carterae.2
MARCPCMGQAMDRHHGCTRCSQEQDSMLLVVLRKVNVKKLQRLIHDLSLIHPCTRIRMVTRSCTFCDKVALSALRNVAGTWSPVCIAEHVWV